MNTPKYSETTLKPCPFCGGEASVERIGGNGYYFVACSGLNCCDSALADTEAEAIEAWNTRAERTCKHDRMNNDECGAFVDNVPPYAEGGTVSETYIDGGENGSICPIPRANVIFEGQKLTFDDEDSAKFAVLVKGHFRKLAGLRGDAE